MNGVHDMGGMHGFGPVRPERDEPWFHAEWERRAFALALAMGATGSWTLDQSRAARESIPAATYLASSYYEIWLAALEALMRERGLVREDELVDGRVRTPALALARRLEACDVATALALGSPTERPPPGPARFAPGDAVRTRQMHPDGHTRLPRYVRGRRGTVAAVRGAHVYPDANGMGRGEQPTWLYTVRFDGAELWGADTSASSVSVDCWEPYLVPAAERPA